MQPTRTYYHCYLHLSRTRVIITIYTFRPSMPWSRTCLPRAEIYNTKQTLERSRNYSVTKITISTSSRLLHPAPPPFPHLSPSTTESKFEKGNNANRKETGRASWPGLRRPEVQDIDKNSIEKLIFAREFRSAIPLAMICTGRHQERTWYYVCSGHENQSPGRAPRWTSWCFLVMVYSRHRGLLVILQVFGCLFACNRGSPEHVP